MFTKVSAHKIKPVALIKESIDLIKKKFFTLLPFSLVCYALTYGLMRPLIKYLIAFSCRLAGLSYISNSTFLTWLSSPLSLPILVLCVALWAFVGTAQIAGVIRCFDCAYEDKDAPWYRLLYFGFCDAARLFIPKNLPMLLFILLVIPATGLIDVSGLLQKVHIPEFIDGFILASDPLNTVKKYIVAALWVLAAVWCFALHFFSLERKTAVESMGDSLGLLRGNVFRVAGGLLLWNAALAASFAAVCFLTCSAAAGVCKLTLTASEGYRLMYSLLYVIPACFYGVYSLGSVIFSFSYLGAAFHELRGDIEAYEPPLKARLTKRAGFKFLCFAVVLFSLVLSSISYYFAAVDFYGVMRASKNMPQITAHRGSSEEAPENSLPAFERAIYDCADWIELDVHQTKDGILVVTHDADLYRITGKHVNIYDLTYEEAERYDVGGWFSAEYRGLKIATLEEAIEVCRGKAKLNIELKPTGHETDFAAQVINTVKNCGIEEECLIASTDADTLREVKRLAPEISTLYNMVIAQGDISQIDFADCFSVEETSVTRELIDSVHEAGKEIFVWTVNDTDSIRALADMGVDNIVTDIPWTARWALGSDRFDKVVSPLLKYIFYGQSASTASGLR